MKVVAKPSGKAKFAFLKYVSLHSIYSAAGILFHKPASGPSDAKSKQLMDVITTTGRVDIMAQDHII
jgi:hypothetical protein